MTSHAMVAFCMAWLRKEQAISERAGGGLPRPNVETAHLMTSSAISDRGATSAGVCWHMVHPQHHQDAGIPENRLVIDSIQSLTGTEGFI